MKINKWFSTSEFICKSTDGPEVPYVDSELVKVLTDVREFFGQPVIIVNAYMTPGFNAAADIIVKHVEPALVYEYLDIKYPDSLGLGAGMHKGFNATHIDIRSKKARW